MIFFFKCENSTEIGLSKMATKTPTGSRLVKTKPYRISSVVPLCFGGGDDGWIARASTI